MSLKVPFYEIRYNKISMTFNFIYSSIFGDIKKKKNGANLLLKGQSKTLTVWKGCIRDREGRRKG